MATPQEIQKQLERIAKLYDQLGEKNPFAGADASKISQSEAEVKKLSDSLNGVTNKIKEINAPAFKNASKPYQNKSSYK